MTRISKDEIKYGRVWNGYDYALQAWVVDGIIQDCGHPQEMKAKGCCNGHKLTGRKSWTSQRRKRARSLP